METVETTAARAAAAETAAAMANAEMAVAEVKAVVEMERVGSEVESRDQGEMVEGGIHGGSTIRVRYGAIDGGGGDGGGDWSSGNRNIRLAWRLGFGQSSGVRLWK